MKKHGIHEINADQLPFKLNSLFLTRLWGFCGGVGFVTVLVFNIFFVVDVVTQRVFVLIFFFPQLKWQRSLSKTKKRLQCVKHLSL